MTRTKNVARDRYTVFWNRAMQYDESLKGAFENGAYDAAVSHAVHCAISAIDAVSVLRIGKRSSAQNHNEIAILLKETKTHDESEKGKIIESLSRLIEMKAIAEYEDKPMSKSDAEKAMNQCRKVFAFAEEEIDRKG